MAPDMELEVKEVSKLSVSSVSSCDNGEPFRNKIAVAMAFKRYVRDSSKKEKAKQIVLFLASCALNKAASRNQVLIRIWVTRRNASVEPLFCFHHLHRHSHNGVQQKSQIPIQAIGKVESRQSVFNRLGASPKEVSPKEVKRKSVHERLGPVAIIKKYTKSPLSIEPSKEIKSAVPSRMRREADVNVLCGEVLKIRPKIIVHTSMQEENEESMESSYATYQNDKDVEAPKNWRVIAWP
nr:uncharacterized protein LOC109150426 [Ipomoea batatas]